MDDGWMIDISLHQPLFPNHPASHQLTLTESFAKTASPRATAALRAIRRPFLACSNIDIAVN
jgi:hypothetical protein